MAINKQNTNMLSGSGAGGAYQELGVGSNSQSYREATTKGKFSGGAGGLRSQGETPGVGSVYSAVLNERPNISNPRNRGPERPPSIDGRKAIPITTMGSRAVSRV